jgi:hypothetical protein
MALCRAQQPWSARRTLRTDIWRTLKTHFCGEFLVQVCKIFQAIVKPTSDDASHVILSISAGLWLPQQRATVDGSCAGSASQVTLASCSGSGSGSLHSLSLLLTLYRDVVLHELSGIYRRPLPRSRLSFLCLILPFLPDPPESPSALRLSHSSASPAFRVGERFNMGNSSPPYMYGHPDAFRFKGPTDRPFNPKAVTESSWTRPAPKPKPKGPLVNFNRHPDSVCIPLARQGMR